MSPDNLAIDGLAPVLLRIAAAAADHDGRLGELLRLGAAAGTCSLSVYSIAGVASSEALERGRRAEDADERGPQQIRVPGAAGREEEGEGEGGEGEPREEALALLDVRLEVGVGLAGGGGGRQVQQRRERYPRQRVRDALQSTVSLCCREVSVRTREDDAVSRRQLSSSAASGG